MLQKHWNNTIKKKTQDHKYFTLQGLEGQHSYSVEN